MRPITAPAQHSPNARLIHRKPKEDTLRPMTAPVNELCLANGDQSPDDLLKQSTAPIQSKDI